jgi:hypothetical protein
VNKSIPLTENDSVIDTFNLCFDIETSELIIQCLCYETIGIRSQLSKHLSKLTFDLWIIYCCPSKFAHK